MTLITCPECRKEISAQASTCPSCGYPLEQKPKEKVKSSGALKIFAGVIGALFLIGFTAYIIGSTAKPTGSSTPTINKVKAGVPQGGRILYLFEKAGIWKVDEENHRCLVDPGVWRSLPFEKKEDALRIIYREEATWWKLYDAYSGKLLGKVDSWGVKIYP